MHLVLLFSLTFSVYGRTLMEDGASDFFTIKKFQEGNEIDVEIFDLKGTKLSSERIILDNDLFKSYSWKQLQTGDKVDLELKDNKLHFKSDDKKKTIQFSKEELKKIVLPPLLTNSLLARIKKNPEAKKIELIVIVPDKMMTLEFNFEKKAENKKETEWVLNPNSFFVGLIVGPVKMTFDKDLKLLKIKDITLPIKPTQKTEIIFK
jgi:hypothetical protein